MSRRDPAVVPAGVTTPEPAVPAPAPAGDPPADDGFAPLAGAGGCGGAAFVAVWTLGWVAGLGVFAVALAPDYWLAVRSYGFAEASGRVIDCRVVTHSGGGGDGPTYSLDLSYAYRVNGRNHVGTRYDANSSSDSDRGWYRRTADALRPDAAVTVFHDPADPAASLLVPGVTGGHLFKAVFFTPFALVALLGARYCWGRMRRRGSPGTPETVTDGRLIRVPLAPVSPLVAGASVAGGACFIGSFVVAFGFGFRPPVWVPGAVLLTAAGAAVSAGGRVAWRSAAGAYDLVIDPDRALLALPLTHGRGVRLVVPFAGVDRVAVDEQTDSDGSTYAAAVFLTAAAAEMLGAKPTQPLTLHTGPSPRCRVRDGLVEWLRAELDRPAK